MTFDLIILGGRVADGTGTPVRSADVGVAGDRIAAIGNLADASAARVIEASGCVVAPGFIDVHAHSDAYLLIEPDAPSKLAQGITTEVNGQCGGSGVPRLGQARLVVAQGTHSGRTRRIHSGSQSHCSHGHGVSHRAALTATVHDGDTTTAPLPSRHAVLLQLVVPS